jgi:hypothetical protein
MKASLYDTGFFEYVDLTAARSASRVVPLMASAIEACSVVDVGCGRGAWLLEWQRSGVHDVLGIDMPHAPNANLLASFGRFRTADLSRPLSLNRRFELAMCLEVAEHLPQESAPLLIQSLCGLSDAVFFSAATPGQGGLGHINEQPLNYWINLFREAGYDAFDALRPQLQTIAEVEPWYRYNLVLFARGAALGRLSASALGSRISPGVSPPTFESLVWRLRRSMLRQLPRTLVDKLARRKHRSSRFWR